MSHSSYLRILERGGGEYLEAMQRDMDELAEPAGEPEAAAIRDADLRPRRARGRLRAWCDGAEVRDP